LYILLIGIGGVTVPFVCCSVKLPLSQPMSFCFFLSILLLTPAGGRGDRATAWSFVVDQGQTATPPPTSASPLPTPGYGHPVQYE